MNRDPSTPDKRINLLVRRRFNSRPNSKWTSVSLHTFFTGINYYYSHKHWISANIEFRCWCWCVCVRARAASSCYKFQYAHDILAHWHEQVWAYGSCASTKCVNPCVSRSMIDKLHFKHFSHTHTQQVIVGSWESYSIDLNKIRRRHTEQTACSHRRKW